MYLVKITCLAPYPIEKEYRIKAGNHASAAGRGIREWRKENKGRRIKSLKIEIIKL